MIFMAMQDYNNFVSAVTSESAVKDKLDCSGKYCYSENESCAWFESRLSSLQIALDQSTYTVPAYAYLAAGFNGHKCALTISYIDSFLNDRYILGDTFIKNYYMTFDYSS